jgi:hypothetical protein
MNYYIIQESGNLKIIGKYPQVQSIHNNCHVWDEPKFVEHIHHEKVDFEPITSNAILHKKSKQTDLINVNEAMGFSGKLLISGKLKTILQNNRKSGMQFFKAPIIQNNLLVEDYWILNMYEFNNDYVDFLNSKILLEEITFENINSLYLRINSLKDYELKIEEIRGKKGCNLRIEKLVLSKDKIYNDFFMIRYSFSGIYFVSEKLKKEIEDADCTGIEFQPIELSFNEWTMPGGEREKLYGKA